MLFHKHHFTLLPGAADGCTESSALVDDNGSEEDYSYEELCQPTPRYLQPGGEQLAINEVMKIKLLHMSLFKLQYLV